MQESPGASSSRKSLDSSAPSVKPAAAALSEAKVGHLDGPPGQGPGTPREQRRKRRQWTVPSSMSLENLLRILPVGVVSKNFMGLLRILRKSSSWSLEEARRVPYGPEHKRSDGDRGWPGGSVGA